jgi:hypothetical protein
MASPAARISRMPPADSSFRNVRIVLIIYWLHKQSPPVVLSFEAWRRLSRDGRRGSSSQSAGSVSVTYALQLYRRLSFGFREEFLQLVVPRRLGVTIMFGEGTIVVPDRDAENIAMCLDLPAFR